MIALDATFLIDYLNGVDATAAFLDQQDAPVYYSSAIAMFEIYQGAAQHDGDAIATAEESLDWVEPLEFDHEAAKEAARVNAEAMENGRSINIGDVLIAGICRRHGATLVTRDGDFGTITGLETIDY
ncbi:PIN domain-containing protein [Natrialba sp. PRR66]|uniref:PIN domain-containing protein n=1 Tax=Natrialba sp. PRR66 TaxID=3098146 RepID=UPI002B1D8DD0|nr:PIN domain-containing protein [Natrialba sp. PRR66]